MIFEVCQAYDEAVPAWVIRDTLVSVGAKAKGGLSKHKLHLWLVHMFGDCGKLDFQHHVSEFVVVATNYASELRGRGGDGYS